MGIFDKLKKNKNDTTKNKIEANGWDAITE